jgi:hypothetical protein
MSPRWSPFKKGAHVRLRGRTRDTTTLVKDYLVQETLDPLRTLARYVAFGSIGSAFVSIGTLMLLVALLRLLQGETGAFYGNLSWLPYVIVAVVALVVVALTAMRIVSGPARRRQPKAAKEPS